MTNSARNHFPNNRGRNIRSEKLCASDCVEDTPGSCDRGANYSKKSLELWTKSQLKSQKVKEKVKKSLEKVKTSLEKVNDALDKKSNKKSKSQSQKVKEKVKKSKKKSKT